LVFDVAKPEIERLTSIAWKAYADSRKAPRPHKAGPEFANPAGAGRRSFSVVVHGEVEGVDGVRRALSDWLSWMAKLTAPRPN
jgi:hypothetical protein